MEECANCCSPIGHVSKIFDLKILNTTPNPVSVTTGLNFIFKASGREMKELPETNPSGPRRLCVSCLALAFELYQLHQKFSALTKYNSAVNKTFQVLDPEPEVVPVILKTVSLGNPSEEIMKSKPVFKNQTKKSQKNGPEMDPLPDFSQKTDSNSELYYAFRFSGPCSEPDCSYLFQGSSKLQVRVHFSKFHGRQVKLLTCCQICGIWLSATKSTNILRHLKTHRSDKDLNSLLRKCRDFNYSFLRSQCGLNLKRVIQNGDDDAVEPKEDTSSASKKYLHYCYKCERGFKSRHSLYKHNNRFHNWIHKFICPICDSSISISQGYSAHLRLHTDPRTLPNGSDEFPCPYHGCSEVFSEFHSLAKHTIIHVPLEHRKEFANFPFTVEKPHVCHQCGDRFREKLSLITHVSRKHVNTESLTSSSKLPSKEPENNFNAAKLSPWNKRRVQKILKRSEVSLNPEPPISIEMEIDDDNDQLHKIQNDPLAIDSSAPTTGTTPKGLTPKGKAYYLRYSGPCSEPNCTYVFDGESRVEIRKHFEDQHDRRIKVYLRCHLCERKLELTHNVSLRIKHLLSHNTGENEAALLNAFTEFNDATLRTHCGLVLSRVFTEDSEVNPTFEHSDSAAMEIDTEPEKPETCRICSKDFRSMESLRIHIGRTHRDRKLTCPICSKPIYGRTIASQHLETHLNTEERFEYNIRKLRFPFPRQSFPCLECKEAFSDTDSYRNHVLSHSPIETESESHEPYTCPVPCCTFSAWDSEAIRDHRELVHLNYNPPAGPFSCTRCNQEFLVRAQLQMHKSFCCDPLERPYLCDTCGRRFRVKQNLARHYRDWHKLGQERAWALVYQEQYAQNLPESASEQDLLGGISLPEGIEISNITNSQQISPSDSNASTSFKLEVSEPDIFPENMVSCELGYEQQPSPSEAPLDVKIKTEVQSNYILPDEDGQNISITEGLEGCQEQNFDGPGSNSNSTEFEDVYVNQLQTRYNGPCSKSGCPHIFDRVTRQEVRVHFIQGHGQTISFNRICHICGRNLKHGVEARLKHFMYHHPGQDPEALAEEWRRKSDLVLSTTCGLKLAAEIIPALDKPPVLLYRRLMSGHSDGPCPPVGSENGFQPLNLSISTVMPVDSDSPRMQQKQVQHMDTTPDRRASTTANDDPFICPNCFQQFESYKDLNIHRGFTCERNDRPYACTICGRRFASKKHLEGHYMNFHKLGAENARALVFPGVPLRRRRRNPNDGRRARGT